MLLVIGVPPGVAWWFVVHPFTRFWRRLGARASLTILMLLLLASVAALYPFRDALLIRDFGFEPWLALLAVPLLGISGLIAKRRARYLDFRTLMGAPELASDPGSSKLLREGIYARIRHPRYVEFALGILGWSLAVNFLGVYLLAAATAVALHVVVLLEERELRERFGRDYEDYAARVPRYLPRR